ncbi:MAG: hypothetical protein SNJ77_07715 [Cytophagales bacterium]
MLLKEYAKLLTFFLLIVLGVACDSWDKNEKETPNTKIEKIDSSDVKIDTVEKVIIVDSSAIKRQEEENRVIKKVKELPECQRLERIVNARPQNNANKLDYQLVSRPTEKDPNFYVKVNEKTSNGTFVKIQVFLNSKTDSIMIYDPGEDRLLSLEEWRRLELE